MKITIIPAGYQALIEKLSLKIMPHYRRSYITFEGQGSEGRLQDSIEIYIYPKRYLPKDTLCSQLEFSLKYDGVNLEILKAVFAASGKAELLDYIRSSPGGKYARRLWFLYEYLLQEALDIDDLTQGNYIDLLPEDAYFVSSQQKSARHRVNNNLLGNFFFSPVVRKTSLINSFINKKLSDKAKKIIKKYPADIVHKANQFLYLKETKSSFAIEKENPNLKRTNKFIQVLQEVNSIPEITKDVLISLQNMIVDKRFADTDYRVTQNYVGEVLMGYRQKIHYVSPKPENVHQLMEGLTLLIDKLVASRVEPVVSAAVGAFAFVFTHPFEDGNGRLHRFLIHYLLSKLEFTPKDAIFPVSATMLADLRSYDNCLEQFSKSLLELIDYTLDENGKLSVHNNTIDFYRYFDATKMVEYLYSVIEKTIDTDLIEELEFLVHYAKAKTEIQDIVDLPDKSIDLIIKSILDNSGKLSESKRKRHFDALTDREVEKIENVVRGSFIEK